jgi:hypothetical protein
MSTAKAGAPSGAEAAASSVRPFGHQRRSGTVLTLLVVLRVVRSRATEVLDRTAGAEAFRGVQSGGDDVHIAAVADLAEQVRELELVVVDGVDVVAVGEVEPQAARVAPDERAVEAVEVALVDDAVELVQLVVRGGERLDGVDAVVTQEVDVARRLFGGRTCGHLDHSNL